MSTADRGRGAPTADQRGSVLRARNQRGPTDPLTTSNAADLAAPSNFPIKTAEQQQFVVQPRAGLASTRNLKFRGASQRGRGANFTGERRASYSTEPNRPFTSENRRGNRRPFPRPGSATTAGRNDDRPSHKPSSAPRIHWSMITKLLDRKPDDILADLLHPNFPLTELLNDSRMATKSEWIVNMTTILELVTKCEHSRERVAMILRKIPKTEYINGVHEEVVRRDPITDELPYGFIKSFLNMANEFVAMIPHSVENLVTVFERIELNFLKVETKPPEFDEANAILKEINEHMKNVEYRKNQQKVAMREAKTTANDPITVQDVGPPPDDYRLLPVVPDVREILSEEQVYLRKNIVNGVYEDAQHYLDIHFRLLREDFVGPLRDGIQQHLSGEPGKNFAVRIYDDVRLCGAGLSPRSGIVYDIRLNMAKLSKISWANSRRLIYGNLLVLSFDGFHSCIFVTIEDRTQIEKTGVVSVKTLDKLNNEGPIQIDLDQIDFSYPLTMVETMTYFEAYRPVLNALQLIDPNGTFPLEPYLLKLDKNVTPPDYVCRSTTYDFTPLLVDPSSDVKASFLVQQLPQQRRGPNRPPVGPSVVKKFQIRYKEENTVPAKYKAVSLLNESAWPTNDELHLNPKQRAALILALTKKVALIQGPPGTGKTYLGVRITEMLLYNRAVWSPPDEQSTPILMICHTNHALDQFLEFIVKRLHIRDGVIRVGNRCQNPAIQPFSLLNARRFARESRAIPGHIYHQKHTILDRKAEAEEILKAQQSKVEQSQTTIMPLSIFRSYCIISDRHVTSLLNAYSNEYVETVLMDWLGVGHSYNQTSQDLDGWNDLTESMAEVQLDESPREKESQIDGHEEQESEGQAAQGDPSGQENNAVEMNEEEEEEQRRRDELEMEVDLFVSSAVLKPQAAKSKSTNETTAEKTTADDDGWHVVQKKPANRRRMIQYILQLPTTLTEDAVQQLPDDLWQLTLAQRHDLYRFWLLRYQIFLHESVRGARQEYNQAIAALAEYHQEEDTYILKDSVIVAMTTTCAAKYHTVLEKLQSKIVIVEEAAAIFESHIITALSSKCEHLILIGDHVQLRPNPSVYRLATKYKIDVSLFERFVANQFPNVRLNIQHRMRPEVSRLMTHFYDDLADHNSVRTEREPVRGVDCSVYFINHQNIESTVIDGSSKRNEFEAKYVVALAQYLVKQSYRADQITILVMYLGQRQLIAKTAKNIKLLQGLHIMVTDNYQGEENDIVILSLVRSNKEKSIGFLKTHNRICVALSRARCGLFVIGNMSMLAEVDEMWKKIATSLRDTNAIGTGLRLSCRAHSKEPFIADKPESFAQRPEGGCNKPCDARLRCGHQCTLMCHNYDFEHKEIVCRKKCNEVLSCSHLCTKQCHALTPAQHNPCRVLVDKTVQPCGHTIKFQCALTPTTGDCQFPVLKRLPCTHAVPVPCRIVSSPSELKRFPCPTPCDTMLACKHRCAGTCERCQTGQLHVPCQQKCGRPLICSHVCKAPCASNCPPCWQPCETRCVHSQCPKKCGDLCTPCKEPCAYKCEHLQCTRLCSEPCNRGPCNAPCTKKLRCGHDCIGICGEPCPWQCRDCNKLAVQEIFFGTEDEPDARFVLLPDCKHLFEVTALDKYVENFDSASGDKVALRFPECPRCKKPIHRCLRYVPITNRVHNLIAQAKKKILGIQSAQEMNARRVRLIDDYEKARDKLTEIGLAPMDMLVEALRDPEGFLSDDILMLIRNILLFLQEANKLKLDGRAKLMRVTFEDLVATPINRIVQNLFLNRQHRNFAEQQINDIQGEFERVRRVIYIETLLQSLHPSSSSQQPKPSEKDDLNLMQCLTNKPGPFTDVDQRRFDELAKKLQHLGNLPGLGISEKERVAIVGALNLTQGHWYVCPNGHPYVITECGGANQESACPECGAGIGGQNHQLLPTNRHFGLMDGSQHAAWSNEANVNVMPNPM